MEDKDKLFTQIKALKNNGVHNFSLGGLDAYFYLVEDIEKGMINLDRGVLILPKRKKVFCYYVEPDQIDLLQTLQKSVPIYSLIPIEGLEKGREFCEITYNLKDVFNPATYPNKKKRYNKIVYPFRWIESNKIICCDEADFSLISSFHKNWVQHKLEDKYTFKILFPRKRYLHCVQRYLDSRKSPNSYNIQYEGFFFFLNQELVSIRIVSLNGCEGYDLANFTNTWSTPSQLSIYLDVFILKKLYDRGIQYFNCGAAFGPRIKTFKCHLPSSEKISYIYGKISEKKDKEEKKGFF